MSSVKARTSLFESGEAFNKKKPAPKKQQDKKRNPSEEEEEDGAFQFADLVKALTGSFDGSTEDDGVDALRETFKILDVDQDGFITMEDLKSALAGFNEDDDEDPDEEELQEMIAAADDQGNGKISFESFIKIVDPKVAEARKGGKVSRRK